MPYVVNNPSKGDRQVSRLSVQEGGTGSSTANAALAALSAFKQSQRGQPNNPAPLNATRKFEASMVRSASFTNVSIDGPTSLGVSEKALYFITTYDSFETYVVSAESGTATLKDGYIEYQAPGEPGVAGFTVNERVFNITVNGIFVKKPEIINPFSGEIVGVPYQLDGSGQHYYDPLIVTTDGFSVAGTTEAQETSDWEVLVRETTDLPSASSSVLPGSLDEWTMLAFYYQGDFKTQLTIPGSVIAAKGNDLVLAARVRHNTLTHQSEWSDYVYFKVLVTESSLSTTVGKPTISGANYALHSYGSPYPRLLPKISIFLDELQDASLITRTEYKIFEGVTESPTTKSYTFTPANGVSISSYQAEGYFKYGQLYTIQARYYREDTGQFTEWSVPYTLLTPASASTVFEEFQTVFVYKEVGQDGIDNDLSDETLPVYTPASHEGSFTVYTLDGLIRNYVPVGKHAATQWEISFHQDFIEVFHTEETTGPLSRFAKTFVNVFFPEADFVDYLDTVVFIRARYKDENGLYSNWSPNTTYSRFKLRDFV